MFFVSLHGMILEPMRDIRLKLNQNIFFIKFKDQDT